MLSYKAKIRFACQLVFAGLLIVALWHWRLWQNIPTLIAQDTLWHLFPVARVTLVALATCAVVATALCCLVKSILVESYFLAGSGSHSDAWIAAFVVDLTTTVLLLWGALSIAPQLFYSLYLIVIPELPSQWVVNFIPLEVLLKFMDLAFADSMAKLLMGVLLLSVLVASALFWVISGAKILNSKH